MPALPTLIYTFENPPHTIQVPARGYDEALAVLHSRLGEPSGRWKARWQLVGIFPDRRSLERGIPTGASTGDD